MPPITPYTVQKFRRGYALVWYEGKKRHRSQLASIERSSAEAEARQLWERANDSPWTVGRVVGAYIADLADKQAPSSQRRKDAWKAMRAFWENVDPALIDRKMCQSYRDTRAVADATARYELLMLSTALNWAGPAKVPHKPKIWLPDKDEYQVRYLSREQFAKFFAAVKAPHARLYVQIGLYTMARPSAILELKWDQVDFDRRKIQLNPDGRKQTAKKRPVVPMNTILYEALLVAYAAREGVFVIECGAEPILSIKKAFQAASKRSGVKATPYTLRHTGAVWAAEAGVSMAELAQAMGHDDDRTTQKHYARFSPEHLRHVAEKIAQPREIE